MKHLHLCTAPIVAAALLTTAISVQARPGGMGGHGMGGHGGRMGDPEEVAALAAQHADRATGRSIRDLAQALERQRDAIGQLLAQDGVTPAQLRTQEAQAIKLHIDFRTAVANAADASPRLKEALEALHETREEERHILRLLRRNDSAMARVVDAARRGQAETIRQGQARMEQRRKKMREMMRKRGKGKGRMALRGHPGHERHEAHGLDDHDMHQGHGDHDEMEEHSEMHESSADALVAMHRQHWQHRQEKRAYLAAIRQVLDANPDLRASLLKEAGKRKGWRGKGLKGHKGHKGRMGGRYHR